jgi:hypothetical protein
MARKGGNPDWGSSKLPKVRPATASEFEIEVRLLGLGLTPETCVASPELRRWCERNKNRYYIPERLLKQWDIHVDTNAA